MDNAQVSDISFTGPVKYPSLFIMTPNNAENMGKATGTMVIGPAATAREP